MLTDEDGSCLALRPPPDDEIKSPSVTIVPISQEGALKGGIAYRREKGGSEGAKEGTEGVMRAQEGRGSTEGTLEGTEWQVEGRGRGGRALRGALEMSFKGGGKAT